MCFCLEGEGRRASPVMSEAPTCPVLEDGWLQTPRSKRNVPAAPSGNSEEMIHFQHHFTQDDLITFREWTVPRMRTRRPRRVAAEPGMCAITRHLWHGVSRQYYRNRSITTHLLGEGWTVSADWNTPSDHLYNHFCYSFSGIHNYSSFLMLDKMGSN